MPRRPYSYVGPASIRETSQSAPPGTPITNLNQLTEWINSHADDRQPDGTITATFVVDLGGYVLLAPRHSEHVACATGGPVLSAGEVTLAADGEVVEITNQSTGFCPEPESWPHVAAALDCIPVRRPHAFTTAIVFRLCSACDQRNIVKDEWFKCDLCGADLPALWNFPN